MSFREVSHGLRNILYLFQLSDVIMFPPKIKIYRCYEYFMEKSCNSTSKVRHNFF